MKLIVTIPCYNEEENLAAVIREIPRKIHPFTSVEVLVADDGSTDRTREVAREAGADHIVGLKANRGLAHNFRTAIDAALAHGADVIVNTDGDNHYDQSRIAELVAPIVAGKAEIVIGARDVKKLTGMRWINKYGNMLGSWFVNLLTGLKGFDVSTGFRAYSREAALRLNVLSNHTYTHETLVQAVDLGIVVTQVVITARKVTRPSRLIKSIRKHITRSLVVIIRTYLLYKPLKIFLAMGSLIMVLGLAFIVRFLYLYSLGTGEGHIQSLILAGMLCIVGFQIIVMGLLASAIGWNRKIEEQILYRTKKIQYARSTDKHIAD